MNKLKISQLKLNMNNDMADIGSPKHLKTDGNTNTNVEHLNNNSSTIKNLIQPKKGSGIFFQKYFDKFIFS